MSFSFLFLDIFRRYELADATELADTSPPELAARLRDHLARWSEIITQVEGVPARGSGELVAQILGFENGTDCAEALAQLESNPPALPSPDTCNKLFSMLVTWPGPKDSDGGLVASALQSGKLMSFVVIGHSHGHAAAKLLNLPLGAGLDLAARLHGAQSWAQFTYDAPYWNKLEAPSE